MTRITRLSILPIASLIILLIILLPGRSPANAQTVEPSPTTETGTPTLPVTPEFSGTPTSDPSATPTPPLATSLPASPTETPTPTLLPTEASSPTPTPSQAFTESPAPGIADDTEATPTPSATPTASATPGEPVLSFPLIIRQPTVTPTPTPTFAPVEQLLVCRSPDVIIPDNNLSGVSDTIQINDSRVIQDLDLRLDISHTYTSDLVVNLTHVASGTTVNLLNRPGSGCKLDNIKAIFDDDHYLHANSQCVNNGEYPYPPNPTIGGIFRPNQLLNAVNNLSARGGWRLTVSDQGPSDTGTLRSWCIYTQVGNPVTPTPTPPPPLLPSRAHVSGTVSHNQYYHLDCESRVAVDYAAFFGVRINEQDFFWSLPTSSNPDRGFVGDVNGTWGQIPPNDYGVHAEPVAALLRDYGVSAYAHKGMTWEELRAEIAAGKPVFVWDVGSVYNGWPTYFTASDGKVSIVANYEHVVQVIGYDLADNTVEIWDNGRYYPRNIAQFLRSWSALDNMAIISHP